MISQKKEIAAQIKEEAHFAYKALEDKKAEDIQIIDIAGISVIADYFVIANGSNSNHVQAMVDNVEEALYKAGYKEYHVEGRDSGWVLMDYGDIIVHIFNKESRDYYNLERIWKDGIFVDAADL